MKKLKGTIMITVVIIISTLSLLILTITSAVVGSYKKSVDILEKRDTSYAAEAYGETFMYYINRVAELALNYAVNYYFTQEGTLKHDVPGQVSLLLSPDYEPGNIFMNYINKVISKNQAWDMIKTGIEILLKDQCYKFFSDAGSFIGLTVNAGGPIYINRVSLLENYIKVLLQGKVSSRLESIQVEDWKLNPSNVLPDGYTFYITSTESSTGESKVKRVLRIDCEISFDKNNFDSGNILSLNSPVANSIFDILNYALYTNGSFIANYNFAINGGNLFTGGNFTSHGGLQLNIENMVVKNNFHLGTTSNPLIFNDTITVRGITYIERNFERSGRTRKQLSLDMNKVFIGGNAYIKGKGEYIFKELFVKGNVELDGDVDQEANVAIENKALVAGDIIMTSYSQIVVKSGAELVCRNLYVMNSNNKIILENNSKLIVKSISNLSVVENRGGILSITNLDPSFDLPLVFKELENFKFLSAADLPPIVPDDPIVPQSIDSAVDLTVAPPKAFVVGENCNAGEIETELRNRFISYGISPVPKPLGLHVFARNNITVSVGTDIFNGQLIALGNTLNINSSSGNPFEGVKLEYSPPTLYLREELKNLTGYSAPNLFNSRLISSSKTQLVKIKRWNMVIK